jgi:2-methylcitrate dehydratase PrpD
MSTGEGVTAILAHFIAQSRYEGLPQDVVNQTKKCVLDLIGAAIGGSKTDVGRMMVEFIKQIDTREESRIVGWNSKASSPYAALAIGSMAQDLELDDVNRMSHMHPGVSTIPTALSLCDKEKKSGRDLIISTVVGYEVVNRIGKSVSPSILRDTVFHPAVLWTFGSIASACKVLGLDAETCVNAIGMGSLGPTAVEDPFRQGVMVKDLYGGWPNFVGIMCSLMAMRGFTGSRTLIESDLGIAKMASKQHDLTRIAKDLGDTYEIMNSGFKPYAACRRAHPAIDATLEILDKHTIEPQKIRRIDVGTFCAASRLTNTHPDNPVAARYSIPYALALTLFKRKVWIEDFNQSVLQDEKILNLAKKVHVYLNEELDKLYDSKWPALVEIELEGGERYSSQVDWPKGEPEIPLSDKQIKQKFISTASTVIGEKKAHRVVEIIDDLEDLSNVAVLTGLLVPDSGSKR